MFFLTIYAFCQEGDSSHWTMQYIKGIKDEAKRKNYDVCIIECGLDSSVFPPEISSVGSAIVLCSSYDWTKGICALLSNLYIKPILVGCDDNGEFSAIGYVLMDYKKAVHDLLDYFGTCHRKKVALFAVSLDSPADKIKADSFLSYVGKNGERYDQQDVFYFRGLTKNTCESFISVCSNYDAVIGTNDVSTVILLQMLSANGIKVPDDIFVASFGDASLSKSTTSELTLALLDCRNVGIQATRMCATLSSSNFISGFVTRLNCEIDVRNSTANIPIGNRKIPTKIDGDMMLHNSFFSDPHINRIVIAEQVLEKCDSLDLEIMRALINREKYIDIADKLHVSENTVKYRIKRLLNFAKIESRSELTELMKSYLM